MTGSLDIGSKNRGHSMNYIVLIVPDPDEPSKSTVLAGKGGGSGQVQTRVPLLRFTPFFPFWTISYQVDFHFFVV